MLTQWDAAMGRAIALAQSADAPRGVNPRVGCVIIDADGREIGHGYHHGAGTAHAEVEALAVAGDQARGATAVVTLEPCRHTGRTGPCTTALIDAGIARVVFAESDGTAAAGGGADVLRAAGVEVVSGVRADDAAEVNRLWRHVQQTGRPFVTLKMAVSLDGRVADATGGPTAITGHEARAFVHGLRGEVDAIAVGMGTARIDDPQLTARADDGTVLGRQPMRVVLGNGALPPTARVMDASAPTVQIGARNPQEALADLAARGVQHLLLEGGPTIAAAYLAAEVVDEVIWLVAPILLGAGPVSMGVLAHPHAVEVRQIVAMGDDVAVIGAVRRER